MPLKPNQRVVITGLGVVSPIGCDIDSLWQNLISETSGITKIESLPTEHLPFHSGGEAKEFTGAIENYGELEKTLQRSIKKNVKVMCREIEMGVAAAQKALQHSGLGLDRNPERCGCIFGCDYILTRPEEFADGVISCRNSAGGTYDSGDWPVHGLAKVTPLWLLKYLPNMPNSHVSIYNDFLGPNNAITMREASMALSLGEAASIIRRGAAEVMLVGATGTRMHPLRTTHVSMMDPVAKERTPASSMARPFDQTSDGMVLGEGAGAFLLENLESALKRNAKIWGEIVGQGSSMVSPKVSGDHYLRQATRSALKAAVKYSEVKLPEIWHLHAHALGIPDADCGEAQGIADFIDSTSNGPSCVAAAKSYFGNLGAGSAAIEITASLLAMEHGQMFPIMNLKSPIPEATWPIASTQTQPGTMFLHSSYTLQGQAAAIAIAQYAA